MKASDWLKKQPIRSEEEFDWLLRETKVPLHGETWNDKKEEREGTTFLFQENKRLIKMCDDEVQALVVDNGSGMCKAVSLEMTLPVPSSPPLSVALATLVS